MIKFGTLHHHIVGKLEAAFETPAGNALMQEFRIVVGLLVFFAGHREGISFGFNGNLVLRKTCNGHCNAVSIFTQAFNVVGRVSVGFAATGFIQQAEHAVKTDR